MFWKGILTAGMLAVALAFSPVAAEAKTSVHIGIGTGWGGGWGGGCYGHWRRNCGFGHGYRHHRYRHHYGFYGYYPYYNTRFRHRPRVYYRHMSCGSAKASLNNRGYRRIRARDCGGQTYVFTAVKRGHAYRIKIRSRNGAIVSARRI